MPPDVKFKAAVAYYPICDAAVDELTDPDADSYRRIRRLVASGGMPAADAALDGRGAPLKVIVFPEAYHSFDNPLGRPYGTRFFGHWLRYNAEGYGRRRRPKRTTFWRHN